MLLKKLNNPYLIDTNDLEYNEIQSIFEKATYFKENKKNRSFKDLLGINVCLAFFEPSTRTHLSFELASKRLNANTIVFPALSSSQTKGETVIDTILTFEAMEFDIFIIRLSEVGTHKKLVEKTDSLIINAGDGNNQHPSQALLDAFTLREKLGPLKNKKITIVGDIKHSRVARSNINILQKLGVKVSLSAPNELLPDDLNALKVNTYSNIDESIEDGNQIMLLRLQKERLENNIKTSFEDYRTNFAITEEKLKKHNDFIFLHPGPVNYGFELDYNLLFHKNCMIQTQVNNGVYIRMAILSLLRGHLK